VTQPATDGDPGSLYNRVGGLPAMQRVVDAFYRGVETDPVLRPLYPASLDESRQWLALFLAQYWGGPAVYTQRRGHPRLRMRHVPFKIGQRERDAWLTHMLAAIDEAGIEEPARAEMQRYFADAATFMINDRTNVEDRT
jgi:hemoglobin